MVSHATLTFDGRQIELPIVQGTAGEQALDISSLRAQTGLITLDQGYGNTGSCRSAITYIDGEQGILRYRGFPIEEFASEPNFVEVAWLLIFGELPTKDEYARFSEELTRHANIDEDMKNHFNGFPRSAPPMAVLSAMISTLSCFHPEFNELDNPKQFLQLAARLISKIRTLAAYTYRRSLGLPYIYADPNRRYASNFLHMLFSEPYNHYECEADIRKALNLIFILHADHEQNCSSSTVRMVGSSQANLFASVAAGVSALWGPLHGGANVKVIEMLEAIHQGNLTPEAYLELAKQKGNNIRLMGFGHRVYKNFDPRAKMLSEIADKALTRLGVNDPLLDIARKLQDIALHDNYFVERNLYPNVDFYSGILLRAMGIPTSMFTVIFAIGRLPGWIAQWHEQYVDGSTKIARPRQIYTGEVLRHYVPMDQR